MSKKQKPAGKAGSRNSGKKAGIPVKKKSAPARTASAKKPATKSKPGKSKPLVKAVKKIATKAIKAATKNGKKSEVKKPAKKGIIKKVAKTVQKVISSAKKLNGAIAKKNGSKPLEKAGKDKTQKQTLPVTAVKTAKIAPKPAKTVPAAVPSSKKLTGSGNGVAEKKTEVKPATDTRKLNDLFSKKSSDRKPDDVLAITNTIPVKSKNEISPSKIASISNSITNPVRKTDSYSVKAEKEPAGKFEMEFVVHASAEMLYEFLSTASGLSEWFCDDLNIRNGIYTFIWDDQLQQARLLKTIDQQLVRFQWVDKTDGSYFEFRIQRDDLTNDISLIITDFADTSSERESSKLLWNSQVEKLMHVIGSIF